MSRADRPPRIAVVVRPPPDDPDASLAVREGGAVAVRPRPSAEIALLADLAVLFVVAARFTPAPLAGQLLASAPFAVLTVRRGRRDCASGVVLAQLVGFVLGGIGTVISIGIAGLFGFVVGRGVARRWPWWRTVAWCCVVCWPPITLTTLAVLAVFDDLRRLTFEAISTQARGVGRLLGTDLTTDLTGWALRNWLVTVPAFQLGATAVIGFATWRLAGLVARRVGRTLVDRPADAEPLPIAPGEITVVVGANGVGKSTRLRATRLAHHGAVLVAQQPVATVTETTVSAEVGGRVDLLAEAGLGGLADRDPATLSGGQLQRLSLARLLAVRPEVVLTDEATAMLDAAGREWAWSVLRRLADDGAAVVHVSHIDSEITAADRVVTL
jgi:energy-coupling factor transport system permease/ATP-binding protein